MTNADVAHDLFERLGEEALLAYVETIAAYMPRLTPWEQNDTITFVDGSSVRRHLPDQLHPGRTPHYHFVGSPVLPPQNERKEPANPSAQRPPRVDNTHLGSPPDTEMIIVEILAGAEGVARGELNIPATEESYANQNHQRAIAIFMATTPHAQHMINDVMGTATIPPELQHDDELVTAMITSTCVGSLHTKN